MRKFEKYLSDVSQELKEMAAELGKGVEGKPTIRYYLGGNPKPLKFEDLPPESKQAAQKLMDKYKPLMQKMSGGKFDTKNGFDINFKADGKVEMNSPSTGVTKTVRI